MKSKLIICAVVASMLTACSNISEEVTTTATTPESDATTTVQTESTTTTTQTESTTTTTEATQTEEVTEATTTPEQSQDTTTAPEPEVVLTLSNEEYNEAKEAFGEFSHFDESNIASYYVYSQENPDVSPEKVVTYVNVGLDRPFYTDTTVVSDPDSILVLINKYNSIPSDWLPNDLMLLPSSMCTPGRDLYMRWEAAQAFEKLHNDAKELGLTILAHSTHRTYSYQKMLYDNYCASYSVANADTYSARPGYSEHHTGLAVDVKNADSNYNQFVYTDEYQWMKDNAHKYGFIQRYIEGTQWITGYITEEWHYRYVGVEVATDVYNSGLTYDEYYAIYLQ